MSRFIDRKVIKKGKVCEIKFTCEVWPFSKNGAPDKVGLQGTEKNLLEVIFDEFDWWTGEPGSDYYISGDNGPFEFTIKRVEKKEQ